MEQGYVVKYYPKVWRFYHHTQEPDLDQMKTKLLPLQHHLLPPQK